MLYNPQFFKYKKATHHFRKLKCWAFWNFCKVLKGIDFTTKKLHVCAISWSGARCILALFYRFLPGIQLFCQFFLKISIVHFVSFLNWYVTLFYLENWQSCSNICKSKSNEKWSIWTQILEKRNYQILQNVA